jgi:alkane 1-monooxygenase
LTGLSLEFAGPFSVTALLVSFGLFPTLELLMPASSESLDGAAEQRALARPIYDWMLYAMVPLQYLLLRFCSSGG